MKITFACTGCGRKLKARPDSVGRTRKCPVCETRVTCIAPHILPRPVEPDVFDAEIVEAEVVATPPRPPAVAPHGVPPAEPTSAFDPYADVNDDPYQLAGPDPAATSTPESNRPCPMCGEMILAEAVKCRFCGEILDPRLKKGKTKGKRSRAEDADLSTAEIVLPLIPFVCCWSLGGLIGLIWMIQGKPKGAKMLGISVAAAVFWMAVGIVLRAIVLYSRP